MGLSTEPKVPKEERPALGAGRYDLTNPSLTKLWAQGPGH